MPIRSPKHGLTRSGRGWYRRVGKVPRWIVSAKVCPSGEDADTYYEEHFAEIASKPSVPIDRVTLRQAAARFVDDKQAGKLHRDTVRDYDDTMLIAMRAVGPDVQVARLSSSDAGAVESAFAHMGADRRLKHVVNLRGFVRWCQHPRQKIPCGWRVEDFTPPRKAERRRERAKRRKRPYTANDVRRLLRHASDRMRAIILLAFNAAMGPEEITRLTNADVKGGIIDRARQKTGVERYVPLWDETIAALPKRKGLLFPGPGDEPLHPGRLTRRFHAVCQRAAVDPRGLYNCRRTFRTIADDWGDHRAAAKVMGRELPDVDTVYVLSIKPERIIRMLDHVKSVLKIGPALRARRYGQGKRGLALRLAARRERVEQAKRSKPRGSSGSDRRSAGRGPHHQPSVA